jgi:septal ring factor EnvC (AmiA/AmiB activator)
MMEAQIVRIEEKMQQLLKEFNRAQKEVQRLDKENIKLKQQLLVKHEQAERLQQKIDALKMNGDKLEAGSKKDMEKRINTYLKDIEKCLALLHN